MAIHLYRVCKASEYDGLEKSNWTDNEAIMEDGRDVNAELIDRYYDAGWNKYEDIRRCNMVLARVPEASFTNAEKANFIAQAKTIRAMIYFTRAACSVN